MQVHTQKDNSQLPALRFLTAGQVDDGKSTLIGRLLYDTQALKADRLEKLLHSENGQLNFASLSDGLQSEQAQSITIDVAHHYLNTPERSFILLDTPGHEEYTRNMVTAASNCDAAVILIDASRLPKDFTELPLQTKRHTLLAHLLRVASIVFAIN
ncbi:MAG: GTP-binding protein, partial [Saezia sp.]